MSKQITLRILWASWALFLAALAPAFVEIGPGISIGTPTAAKVSEVAAAGFKLVRLPFKGEPDAKLVELATSKGLRVVLDFHPDLAWYSDPVAVFALPDKWARWSRLFEKYSSEQLAFQLLNEPRMAQRKPAYDSVMVASIEAIREASPNRWIILGNHQLSDADWFDGPLGRWSAPSCSRLIVPLHYYRPYEITHPNSYRQPLRRLPDTPVGEGTKFDLLDWGNRELHFQRYVNWCRENQVTAWIGEAGCYETVPRRVTWLAEIARLARLFEIPVCWWAWGDRFGYRPTQPDADAVLRIMLGK